MTDTEEAFGMTAPTIEQAMAALAPSATRRDHVVADD